MSEKCQILYCHCAFAKVIAPEIKNEVLDQLNESGVAFEAVEDLCAMAAKNDPKLAELSKSPKLKIAACFPRAVKGLFGQTGNPLNDNAEIHNMRTTSANELVETLIADEPEVEETKLEPFVFEDKSEDTNGEWLPWFPVIDYERCTNCMQCLSFCLFGVYGVDAETKIQVQNQDKCKTNCPACSRVCPEAAIMFPKYKSGPVNGEEVSEEDMNRENMKIDISALLGGDIYSTLRQRNKQAEKRFEKERDDKRALSERIRCLNELKKDLDIPPEVLKSLPSPSQIKERAEEAKAKAEQAREESMKRRLEDRYEGDK